MAVKGMTNHATIIESENTIKSNKKIERIEVTFISKFLLKKNNSKKIPVKNNVALWAVGIEKNQNDPDHKFANKAAKIKPLMALPETLKIK